MHGHWKEVFAHSVKIHLKIFMRLWGLLEPDYPTIITKTRAGLEGNYLHSKTLLMNAKSTGIIKPSAKNFYCSTNPSFITKRKNFEVCLRVITVSGWS